MAEPKSEHKNSTSEEDVRVPNLIERADDEIEKSPSHHDKETHGTSDEIDENTPIDEVKGPGVFQRAKEEIEALVSAILPKKEEQHPSPSEK